MLELRLHERVAGRGQRPVGPAEALHPAGLVEVAHDVRIAAPGRHAHVEELRSAMQGLLAPEEVEEALGQALGQCLGLSLPRSGVPGRRPRWAPCGVSCFRQENTERRGDYAASARPREERGSGPAELVEEGFGVREYEWWRGNASRADAWRLGTMKREERRE